MSPASLDHEAQLSHDITLKVLDTILQDFGLVRSNGKSEVKLLRSILAIEEINSRYINISLIGAVPSLTNGIAATQMFEARGGEPQTITIDLQRSHNYLDPDIGMTPTVNGQVSVQSTTTGLMQAETEVGDHPRSGSRESLP